MNLRDFLTILGLCLLAAGPVLKEHVNSVPVYVTGEIFLVIGPVLVGYRALSKDPVAVNSVPAKPLPNPQDFEQQAAPPL